MKFDDVISLRTAIRKFKNDIVSDDLLNKILEAGNLAPTARNMQPQKIYVVKSKEGLEKIDKVSPCRYNAPVCFIVASDKSIACIHDNHSTYEIDATIVAIHMMLEATNLGIDNIWIENFDREKLKIEFNLPDNVEPVMLMPIGYRTDDCPENLNHNVRKSLDSIVEYR